MLELLELDRKLYREMLKEIEIEPRPGFLRFARELNAFEFGVMFGSLTPIEEATVLIERSGLARIFPREKFVLAENVRSLKPSPDVYLATAAKMGISPSEQLVFEDSPNGIRAAIAAGSRAIGMPVYWLPETVSELVKTGAEAVLKHWGQIDSSYCVRYRP